jgi:hypothetical protein
VAYLLLAYGIFVWGQSARALTRRKFTLRKRAVRYMAGIKQLQSCIDCFRQLKILTVYSLYIQETILYAKEMCSSTLNKQLHITRNNKDYNRYGYNLELYDSKPSVAGCIFYNKLPNNIKEIGNNKFKMEVKDLLIK